MSQVFCISKNNWVKILPSNKKYHRDISYNTLSNCYSLAKPIKTMNLPFLFRISPTNKFKTLQIHQLKVNETNFSPRRNFYSGSNYATWNSKGNHKFFGIGDVL